MSTKFDIVPRHKFKQIYRHHHLYLMRVKGIVKAHNDRYRNCTHRGLATFKPDNIKFTGIKRNKDLMDMLSVELREL